MPVRSHLLPIHLLYTCPIFLLHTCPILWTKYRILQESLLRRKCSPLQNWAQCSLQDHWNQEMYSELLCSVYYSPGSRGMLGLEFEYRPPGGLHLLLNWLLQADITHGYCNVLQCTIPYHASFLLATPSQYNTLVLHKCTCAVQCAQYAQYTHTPYHIASFSPLFLHTLQNSSMGHNVIEQKQSSAWIQLCKKTSAE